MTVNQAVKMLRRRCGDTQQVFATDLGLSLRAYIMYEQDQMPEPRALVRLWALALDTRNSDLGEIFAQAVLKQLDSPPGWSVEIGLRKK
jgi:DNA-binding XRE family transcriptional regulator